MYHITDILVWANKVACLKVASKLPKVIVVWFVLSMQLFRQTPQHLIGVWFVLCTKYRWELCVIFVCTVQEAWMVLIWWLDKWSSYSFEKGTSLHAEVIGIIPI